MRCIRCSREAAVKITTGAYCMRCYARLLEKRVRKEARTDKSISPRMRLLCLDEVSAFLVRSLYRDADVSPEMIDSVPDRIPEDTAVLVPWTMDDEIHQFLAAELRGKELAPEKEGTYSLLRSLTDTEVQALADFHGLSFVQNSKDPEAERIISGMSEKYAETRYALYKSVKALK